jgi:uncharacterized protein (DUF1499 family)
MFKPRLTDPPVSRLAVWARRLAFFSFVAALFSVIIVRSGLLEIIPALATFGGALLLAVLSILIALTATVAIWKDGLAGIGYVVTAIVLAAALLAYPAYLGSKALRLPHIADITTDPIDPPRFEAIARARPRTANPVAYAGLYAAEQQRQAYPEVEPLVLNIGASAAYDAALAVIAKRRWRIVDAREPQSRRPGHIEAVARTPVMGFRDDIVLRITASGEDTRIDVRSASRYGRFDFGANAARIASLLEQIDKYVTAQAVAAERERERERKAQEKAQPQPKGRQAPARR